MIDQGSLWKGSNCLPRYYAERPSNLSELGATSPFPIDEWVIDTMNEARVNTVREVKGKLD